MNKKQIKVLLTEWEEQYNSLDKTNDKLRDLFGICPESELSSVMWGLFTKYTESLETILKAEINSTSGWLSWYCWDNVMGKNEFEVTINNKKARKICNIDDLAAMIFDLQENQE